MWTVEYADGKHPLNLSGMLHGEEYDRRRRLLEDGKVVADKRAAPGGTTIPQEVAALADSTPTVGTTPQVLCLFP